VVFARYCGDEMLVGNISLLHEDKGWRLYLEPKLHGEGTRFLSFAEPDDDLPNPVVLMEWLNYRAIVHRERVDYVLRNAHCPQLIKDLVLQYVLLPEATL